VKIEQGMWVLIAMSNWPPWYNPGINGEQH